MAALWDQSSPVVLTWSDSDRTEEARQRLVPLDVQLLDQARPWTAPPLPHLRTPPKHRAVTTENWQHWYNLHHGTKVSGVESVERKMGTETGHKARLKQGRNGEPQANAMCMYSCVANCRSFLIALFIAFMGLKPKFSTTLVATTSTVPIHPGVTVILPILGHHLQEPPNSRIHTYSATEQLMNLNIIYYTYLQLIMDLIRHCALAMAITCILQWYTHEIQSRLARANFCLSILPSVRSKGKLPSSSSSSWMRFSLSFKSWQAGVCCLVGVQGWQTDVKSRMSL